MSNRNDKGGWSVTVVGRVEEITDPGGDHAGRGRRHVLWMAGDTAHWIRVVPSKMTGRRISAVVN